MSHKLLVTGFVLAALCLVLPILWPAALIIGIIAVVRGAVKAGAILIVLSVVLPIAGAFVLQAFFVKPYRVPSAAMSPTFKVGTRFLAWRQGDPGVGDIAVFHPPAGSADGVCGTTGRSYDAGRAGRACSMPTKARSDVNFVKRVVAGPGDTLAVKDGHVIRNGRRQRELFIAACGGGEACDLPKPITIPPDHYFMMGDNRGASDDSRFWGPVPRDWIVGTAFAIYWPTKRIGGI